MAHLQLALGHPFGQLVHAHALRLLAGGLADQEAFAHRGAQGVDAVQLALGIFLTQLLRAEHGVLEGAGQAGGEAQVDHVHPLGQELLEVLGVHQGIDLRGGGELSAPLGGIEVGHRQITARSVSIRGPLPR